MFKLGMKTMFATAVTLAAACGTSSAPAVETAADSAAVTEIGTKFQAAYTAGDAAALGALVTDDYQEAHPDGSVVTGRAAYETAFKLEAEARKAVPGFALELTNVSTTFLSPTVASSTGTWVVKGVPAGSGPDKGSYLVVMKKGTDGQWRMQSGLAAPYVAPPAAAGK